jgi:hypothetical protein
MTKHDKEKLVTPTKESRDFEAAFDPQTERDLRQLLHDPVARQLAAHVSFETLCLSTPPIELHAHACVVTIALRCESDEELNRWWRYVMPDAAWTTADELVRRCERRIDDLAEDQQE